VREVACAATDNGEPIPRWTVCEPRPLHLANRRGQIRGERGSVRFGKALTKPASYRDSSSNALPRPWVAHVSGVAYG
jgi:hypothetical protein